MNVIQVDWSKPASQIYPLAARSTLNVGHLIAELIVALNRNLRVPYENFHLIGSSLGAHVSGFAGQHVIKLTNSKVGRITGLDPASPMFELTSLQFKLDYSDALFVDIIHTDKGRYGINNATGHADFFPNGGHASQPYCGRNIFSDVFSKYYANK